jgi:hypothetical protein
MESLLLLFLDIKALAETLNTTGGVKDALLAGKERMTFRADVNFQERLCAHCFKRVAASAAHCGFHKFWMYPAFHLFSQVYLW